VAGLRQINIRPDAETIELFERVQRSASAAIGLNLSMTDVFRLGMIALNEKYPSPEPANGRPKAAGKRKKGRGM
jgi:hypothetical protein